jgi:site-specific DNA-adenine methylase
MFNWVGNKIKYIEQIKSLTKDFKIVADGMMGSGNVLVELAKTHEIIGNDIIKLMPVLYKHYNEFHISKWIFYDIVNYWKFSKKEHYYKFRDSWNDRYLRDDYNRTFLIETFLLLKMCSNSMVRFNSKGEFNQGFRGCNGPFFDDSKFEQWTKELNDIRNVLIKAKTTFSSVDILSFLSQKFDIKNTVFIFDPPYMLATGMYSRNFSKATEVRILRQIILNKLNFVYFNFLERENKTNEQIQNFAKRYKTVILNIKSSTGQNRKKTSEVKEIMITNI